MKIVFNSPINSINKTTTSKKYSTTTIHNHSASEISNNVAFCGGQNLGVVTTRIKSNKANAIKNGNLYPIPIKDANFGIWTGINKTRHTVDLKKITNIGIKSIKRRHHFMNKFK